MYQKSDKHYLYKIIDMYLEGKIDEAIFCDEFYLSYNLELDHDTLNEKENDAFSHLRDVSSRFSEFDIDHEKYPGVYYTKEELKKTIIQTKEKLNTH